MNTSFLKGVVLVMSFIFFFSSCQEDTCRCEDLLDAQPVQHQSHFLSLRLQAPNELTLRAGTVSEPMTDIQSIRILLYKQVSNVYQLAELKDLSYSSKMSEAFSIQAVPNDYLLVVLANSSPKLKSLTQLGSPLENLTEAQTFSMADLNIQDGTNLYVPMANEQGAIRISREDFHVEKNVDTEQKVHFVRLEPMLARVLVYGSPKLNGSRHAQLPASFLINNMVRSVAPLRPLAKLRTGVMEEAGDNSPRAERYASSSIFTTWQEQVPSNTDLIASYGAELFKVSDFWQTIESELRDYDLSKQHLGLYAKESSLPPSAYLQGITPCVIIKYPFIPKGLSLREGEGFLSFQGTYYSESEAHSSLQAEEDSSLKKLLMDAGVRDEDFSDAFEKGELRFYHQAYSYYTVYLRHFAEASKPKDYGRYGLIRGNEYRVHLKAIEREGSPIAPVLQGNLKPIKEKESLGLKLEVSEISTRDQEVQL